jgi:DNA invertase Pin-like site-specific DNA recombinase
MIAAIYARKSTAQTGSDDESESVDRQLARARAYAARQGWTLNEAHVYVDDGISGAEFGDRRPGLARLLNALRPRPPFHVLVMSEESRLGRESIEVAYSLKQLAQAGVRVFLYLEDRERTIDNPTDKLLMSVAAFADELERERAHQRTYDALHRKAAAGRVAGGAVFGYRNREVLAEDAAGVRRRLYVEREIDPEQAGVVCRIFELCAAGWGFRRIAISLNAEGAPPRGRAGQSGRGPGRRRVSARFSTATSTGARSSGTDAANATPGVGRSQRSGRRPSGCVCPRRICGASATTSGGTHTPASRPGARST